MNKGHLLALLVIVIAIGISFLITAGLIKVVTLCFGWEFKWTYVLGVWVIEIMLKSIFGSKNKKS